MIKKLKLIILIPLILLFWFSISYGAFTSIITWKTVSGSDLAGYSLYQSNDGKTYTKILTLQASATSIKIHNNSKYVSVYYYLVSFDKNGNVSAKSNIVSYIR